MAGVRGKPEMESASSWISLVDYSDPQELLRNGCLMLDHTDTLQLGSRAPEFSLESANRERLVHTLSGFLRRGTLILEFLRGTW
ncbi:MAG: hypothetical protein NVS1B11_35740 [Terriglobales bacterium]